MSGGGFYSAMYADAYSRKTRARFFWGPLAMGRSLLDAIRWYWRHRRDTGDGLPT